EMDLAFPCRDAPDIEIVHRNVEVTTEKNIRIDVTVCVAKSTQSLKPAELEIKLIAPQLAAIWNVCVDDSNSVYRSGDQTLRRFVIIIEEIFLNVLDLVLRNDGD